MNLILICKVEDSQLFLLNSLLNSITKKTNITISIDLVLISKSKIDDNVFFLKENFREIYYIKNFMNVLSFTSKKYDNLISIENTFLGLLISKRIISKQKTSFKKPLAGIVFSNQIDLFDQEKHIISLKDISTLIGNIFKKNKDVIPKYNLENESVNKSKKMFNWIFKTNHNLDLNELNYILFDFKVDYFFKKRHNHLIADLCKYLLINFNYKVILIHSSKDANNFKKINALINVNHNERLILYQQNFKNYFEIFSIYNNSKIILTNKNLRTSFLKLIEFKFYHIKYKQNDFLPDAKYFFKNKKYYQNLTLKIKNQISHIFKNLEFS